MQQMTDGWHCERCLGVFPTQEHLCLADQRELKRPDPEQIEAIKAAMLSVLVDFFGESK